MEYYFAAGIMWLASLGFAAGWAYYRGVDDTEQRWAEAVARKHDIAINKALDSIRTDGRA